MDIKYSSALLIAYLICLICYALYLYKNSAHKMTSEPLTHQYLFWAAILVPLTAFIIIGVICWYGHSVQLDATGFSNFLSLSKFPLALLSLSLPFGVIVTNIHRTIQTNEQISQTKKKNKIDEFYAHQKSHVEYFTSVINGELCFKEKQRHKHAIIINPSIENTEKTVLIKVESPFKLYKKTFNHASTSCNDFNVNQSIINKLKNRWESICQNIQSLKDNTSKNEYDAFRILFETETILKLISSELSLTPYPSATIYTLVNDKVKFGTAFESEDYFKKALQLYMKLTKEYLDIIKEKDIPNDIYEEIMLYTFSSESLLPYDKGWALQKSSTGYYGFEYVYERSI